VYFSLQIQVPSTSLNAAEVLIIGGANSVKISFGFTNPSLSCSCHPMVLQDELGLWRISEVDSLMPFTRRGELISSL
jgi:hypothetical protein